MPTPVPNIAPAADPRTLRDALGCFATGVTVVTCLDEGGQAGRADRQQLHLGQPQAAVAAGLHRQRGGERAGAGWRRRHFAVNVLQTGQQPASIRYSTRHEDRFGPNDWSAGELGAPVLKQSRSSVFECETHAVHEGGDHHMLLGRVIKASFDVEPRTLFYFRGRYRPMHFD